MHQNLPRNWDERELLREKGQFWTPSWVANAMIAYLLKDQPEQILDPAIGKGAFYEAFLSQRNGLKINFHGRDIDLNVLDAPVFSCDRKNLHIEIKDFLKFPPKQKYSGIVANPPYIRHHRIDKATKDELKKICMRITGFTIDGRAGYHIYFLLQALGLLKDKGRLAFIMPADTCEGKFSDGLWKWITKNFSLECVCTFSAQATPFPNVDTNALIFFIKKEKPKNQIKWIEVKEVSDDCLLKFVNSGFQCKNLSSLTIVDRNLDEALGTGLSRPVATDISKYNFSDFANVLRGIATGANSFFFLTSNQISELNIPKKYLIRAVGRTRDVERDLLTHEMLDALDKNNRPTYLIDIKKENAHSLPLALKKYIEIGEQQELPNQPLIKQRKPWYKMEQRDVPPILFAYLGRRNSRFIKNEAAVVPLTSFLCVYPHNSYEDSINNLLKVLNHEDTINNLRVVGKSYGSGAIKVEPSGLRKLPIPENLVEKYKLISCLQEKNGQLRMVKEPNPPLSF